MHLFEKAGWLGLVSFYYLIDANIDPVEVTKKSRISHKKNVPTLLNSSQTRINDYTKKI